MPTQELQLGVHHLRIHRRKKMVRAIKAKNDDMKITMILILLLAQYFGNTDQKFHIQPK